MSQPTGDPIVVDEDDDDTTVVIEVSHPDPGSVSPGVASGSSIGHPDFGQVPTDGEDGDPSTFGGAGFDTGGPGAAAAETVKKHAACDVDHPTGPVGLGWTGPTRTGSDAQSQAKADADEHNRKNAGHAAAVMDGEGAPPAH